MRSTVDSPPQISSSQLRDIFNSFKRIRDYIPSIHGSLVKKLVDKLHRRSKFSTLFHMSKLDIIQEIFSESRLTDPQYFAVYCYYEKIGSRMERVLDPIESKMKNKLNVISKL
ncbi:hypothetical protein RF11_06009 [Thelohanellus kitauei]|uniref:Uncharacterized protein n=1 Tax=Thelohanellus kitauei TaxID=669202 RepID=A0A0C2IUH4_THEKT|nr:hypothetical protein RF11_06009 [Thelohanellus kitauei]